MTAATQEKLANAQEAQLQTFCGTVSNTQMDVAIALMHRDRARIHVAGN
jgi:hypothetical protein